MSDPERILIVRLSHLGDVVCSLGVFHALHRAFPRAAIGWAIQPEFAELVEGLPGLARAFRFERRGGWRAWPRIRRELRSFRPDLTVDAQGNLKSALITLLSGARRRAGFARADWRERIGSLVLNDPAPETPLAAGVARARLHPLERVRTLVRHLASAPDEPRTDPALTDLELDAGREELTRLLARASSGAPPVLCHLSPSEDVRGWPASRWSELLARLRAEDRPVLVLSGPRETELGLRLQREHPDGADLVHRVGQRGLRRLAALFHAAGELGGTFVGCDSGPMHLAWASGLSVRVLEGPESARRTGPWPATYASRSPHVEVRARVTPSCAPCLARACTHAEGPVCMSAIAADDVLAALASRE